MKTLLYCLLPSIQILSNTPHFPVTPCHTPLLAPPPTPIPLLFLLFCFVAFSVVLFAIYLLFYLIIIRIYTCWALVLYYQKDNDVCFMQQGIKFTEVWHICFFTSTLISHTHKQTHTQHTQGTVDWQTYVIYIYTNCYVLTATTFITLNDSLISKVYFRQCLFFSKIIHL